MPSLINRPWWTVFLLFLLLMSFLTSKSSLAAEVHHVRGLVGDYTRIPCLLSSDRLSMIDHQASYYDDNLNRTYDSIRLILFYKESIKTGPIYSIDNRNTQSLRLAKHFASETFHSRLSIEDNLDLNNTNGYSHRKHQAKVELVGEQTLADNSNEGGLNNGGNSKNSQINQINSIPTGSSSTGIQLLGFNEPLETPHYYHHYQQQLEQLEKQKNSIDHNLDTIYLRIDNLKATDTGEYKCRVDFRRGRTLTTHASLKVIVPPTDVRITNLDGDKLNTASSSVDELSEARFVCLSSSSSPVPYFSWQLNNQPIPQHLSTSLSMLWQQQQQKQNQKLSEQSQINKFDQSTLTNHKQQISKLTKQINQDDQDNQKDKKRNKNLKFKNTTIDNDENDFNIQTKLQSSTFATVNYISPAELTTTTGSVLLLRNLTRADIDSVLTCTASHPLYPHSINGSIKLDINLKPATIELEKAKKALISGKLAQFKCRSDGSRPPALITWYLNDKPILDGAKEIVCSNGNCTTSILNLHLLPEHDQQHLYCKAKNTRFMQDFSLEAFIQLNVFFEPILNLTTTSSVMTEGEELILTCQAICKPLAISFSWLFNNKRINLSNKDEITNQGNSSILRIASLTREQAGKYQCIARNLIGERSSQSVDIQVNYLPRCKANQKFVYGADLEETQIRILCDVDSQPLPIRFHWSVQTNHSSVIRQPLEQSSFHFSGSRSSALIQSTRDQLGDVYCSAENSVGLQINPCIFHIIPAGRPDSLDKCALIRVESNEVQISCDSSYDGGLNQVFHLEVYLKKLATVHKHQIPLSNNYNDLNFNNKNSNNNLNNSLVGLSTNSSTVISSSSSVISASRKSIYDEDVEHVLIQNLTNPLEPRFVASRLEPGSNYYFVLYSSNLKGRSRRPLELNARTSNIGNNRNHTLSTFVSVAPPFANIPLSVFTNLNSTHLSYLLAISCIFLLILLFKVRNSKQPIILSRENSDNSSTNLNSNLIEQKSKHSIDFDSVKKSVNKNWIHHNDLSNVSVNDFDPDNSSGNQSKCLTQSTLINNNGNQLTVMLSDNDIIAQSTNSAFNYLQQQISQLGRLSSQQPLFLQQQPQLLVETKSPDLLDQFYQNSEFQLIESKKLMQDTDPNNLLIISKELDDQTLKDAIINDPLLPLHTNLPLLSNQNDNLLNTGNNIQLDSILNSKQSEYTYDTFKQQFEQYQLSNNLALDENYANLMNANVANLNRLNSPNCKASYFSKGNLDNSRIIYSTINTGNQIDLNNSINLTNNTIQLSDNQSSELIGNEIEMSSGPQTIYHMDDKTEQTPFVSNV